mgnify:CR=1 FL=1
MKDKYSRAVANAMRGKCIPYKKETKTALNEMCDNAWRYINVKKALQAQAKRCDYQLLPPRRGSGRDITADIIEFANYFSTDPQELINAIADIINKPESEESSNANSTE